jgi:hypothetical protein
MAALRLAVAGNVLVSSFSGDGKGVSRGTIGTRKCVSVFSDRSRSRMSRYLRSCDASYRFMVTLTYSGDRGSFDRPKDHLARFIKRLRRLFECGTGQTSDVGKERWSIFWFVEFQARGAPHFHIFTNRWIGKDWLARTWYDIVGTGDENHLKAGTRVEALKCDRYGVCSYAMKYCLKTSQKDLPSHLATIGRWWGVCGLSSVRVAVASLTHAQCVLPSIRSRLARLRERLCELEFDSLAKMRVGEFCTSWLLRPAAAEEIFTRVDEICQEATRASQGPGAVMLVIPELALKPQRPSFADIDASQDDYSALWSADESSAPHWTTALRGKK